MVETREYAQPLIAHYNDGHVEDIDEEGYGGFPGHGERDAFAAVSLDDGATWKQDQPVEVRRPIVDLASR